MSTKASNVKLTIGGAEIEGLPDGASISYDAPRGTITVRPVTISQMIARTVRENMDRLLDRAVTHQRALNAGRREHVAWHRLHGWHPRWS